MTRLLLSFSSCLFLVSSLGLAQEPTLPANSLPSTFRSFVAIDKRFEATNARNRTNKIHCFVCEHALNPAVIVFARTVPQEANAPLAALIKELNQLVADYKSKNFAAHMIFLSLDQEYHLDKNRDEPTKRVMAFGEQVDVVNVPFGVAAKSSKSTEAWAIADTDDIVIIYYNKLQQRERWTIPAGQPLTAETIKTVVDTVKKELAD